MSAKVSWAGSFQWLAYDAASPGWGFILIISAPCMPGRSTMRKLELFSAIAADRSDNYCVRALQIIKAQVARKTNKDPLRIVFFEMRKRRCNLQIDEGGELL